MRFKPPSILKSNSGSSIIQATIAAGVAFIVLYAMTSSMLNLNKQSNIVNLKLEVSNLSNQLENVFSKRLQCSHNMVKNNIIVAAPGTIKTTFDVTAAGVSPIAFYSDDGATKLLDVIPGVTGSKLIFDTTNGDVTKRSARIVNISAVDVNGQATGDIEIKYTHSYAGLLGVFKPVEIKGVTFDVNPATGAVTGCQLAPKVRTVGCKVIVGGAGADAPTETFHTGAAPTSINDVCTSGDETTVAGFYSFKCKNPSYTLGGCSSANLKMYSSTSVTNVMVQNNGCMVPNASTTPVTELYITCVGNN